MTPSEFKRTYYPAIERVYAGTGLNPLFVAAQAALETGWGKRRIVRTTEYFRDDRQGGNFVRVHSITPLLDGRYRYDVDRAFRDYDTVEECLHDHFKVLSAKRYAAAMPYRHDVQRFAYEVAKAGYCTADPTVYADSIAKIARMIERA